MAIFDQPLEARLRAYESANRYDRPRDALHLVLICCREPIGANSILTLELISGIQLAQDLPNGESSSAVIHTPRQLHPFKLRVCASCCPQVSVTTTTRTHGFPKEGLGKLPQTLRSIILRSATCLTPQAHSCFLRAHTDTGGRIVKVWGCAPLLLQSNLARCIPSFLFYSPIMPDIH